MAFNRAGPDCRHQGKRFDGGRKERHHADLALAPLVHGRQPEGQFFTVAHDIDADLSTGQRLDEDGELVVLVDLGTVDGHDSIARPDACRGGGPPSPRLDH